MAATRCLSASACPVEADICWSSDCAAAAADSSLTVLVANWSCSLATSALVSAIFCRPPLSVST